MQIDVVSTGSPHQEHAAFLMAAGLKRHGITARLIHRASDCRSDLAVCWGWRTGQALRALEVNTLVMERGHLPPRDRHISLGWNGLAGRGRYPECQDNGERFAASWALEPWRQSGDYALVCGQLQGDAACADVHLDEWYDVVIDALSQRYAEVRFRGHPLSRHAPTRPLADDLAGAIVCAAYSSNALTEAALAGVPIYAGSVGAMAWPVSAQNFHKEPEMPDRTAWANRLAWCQWAEAEISDGTAWAVVRDAL